jgi:hypothetical protein|tara:strand:+ start:92 stop:769 length:678 start_codon:yes stop_codon:yes gene_type:complete
MMDYHELMQILLGTVLFGFLIVGLYRILKSPAVYRSLSSISPTYVDPVEKQKEEKFKEDAEEFGIKVNVLLKHYLETDIPIIEEVKNIRLQRGEILHTVIPDVDWREARVVRTGNVSGVGLTGRVKLAKGLYLRGGTGNINYETEQIYKVIDSGDFFITNKRWFLMGKTSTKKIMLSKILTLNGNFGETKGLVIKRETGKDVLIEIPEFAPEHYATALAIMNKVE